MLNNNVAFKNVLLLNVAFLVGFVSLYGSDQVDLSASVDQKPQGSLMQWSKDTWNSSMKGVGNFAEQQLRKINESSKNKIEKVPSVVLPKTSVEQDKPVVLVPQSVAQKAERNVTPAIASDIKNIVSEKSEVASFFENYYVRGAVVAAATIIVGTIYYLCAAPSWRSQVDKAIMRTEMNPKMMLSELDALLEQWDGTSEQAKIIQYIEENIQMTKELEALLEEYR